ncbi:MAG: hypothetical protein JWP29_1935 [Rhodoferax sp.]|nr:hypothetical protein [Rhodoferax sp.]
MRILRCSLDRLPRHDRTPDRFRSHRQNRATTRLPRLGSARATIAGQEPISCPPDALRRASVDWCHQKE